MKLLKNVFVWLFAILVTASVLIYQRTTGPTYPKRGSVEIDNEKISYRLLRTWENEKEIADRKGARISVTVENTEIVGEIKYKRLGTADDWTVLSMQRDGDELYHMLPAHPAAG